MQGGISGSEVTRVRRRRSSLATTTCFLSVNTNTGILNELPPMTRASLQTATEDPVWSNSLAMLPPGPSGSIHSVEISEWFLPALADFHGRSDERLEVSAPLTESLGQ